MLTMDDRFWSSGEFWEWDDNFDGPSIDIDEFINIIDETTDPSQNISAAASIGQGSCDRPVPDVASQENFQHPSRAANQVSNCADNFEVNYFNNQGMTSDVDFGKPILSENSIGYLVASKKHPCTSMAISAGDVNISPYYSTCAQTDDICRTSNHPSDRQCCMFGNDNHLAGPYRSSFISNNEDSMPKMKDEKEEFTENASFQVENTSTVSRVLCSETEGFNHKADHINDTPSISGVSISNASVDKMVMPNSWIFPSSHVPRKMQTCIKEESSEPAAYDKLHCFSVDASDGHITQFTSSIQADLIPEKGSMMQSSGTLPSISTTKHAVTTKVEDNIFVQSREAHAQNMLEESTRMTFIIDLERSVSGHGLQGAEPSSSCELSDLLRDGSVVETGHSKKIKFSPSNVSPESTQSNSLDNKSHAAIDDSDICILEEICQPVQSITNRNCMVTSQHSIINDSLHHRGAGSVRQSASDERLVFQVALQDLSQQKSETSAPDGLSVPLLRHQRIALSWMVHKEISSLNCIGGILADDQGLGKTISTIALILKERAPSHRACQIDTKCNELDALNLDEDDDGNCGLDESKQASSQFMSVRSPLKTKNAFVQPKGRLSAGTLVVCPTSVLRQWEDELNHKVTRKADLSVLVYHGSNRTKDPCELAKYDVVLTTYSIVSMEVPKQPLVDKDADDKGNAKTDATFMHPCSTKKRKNRRSDCKIHLNGVEEVNDTFIEPINRPLAKVQWFRVVLDEAQSIKNHRTQVARACWGLRAKRRWCLSGTPIQNAVDDLYSYFRFLKYDPYCAYRTFCETIKVPINKNPANGYRKLQAVLKMIMLRRTKGSLLDGEPIITLPPKSVELRRVEFSEVERDFYTRLEADSRAQFKEYAAAGTVKQNYVNILLMLLRLRQACDHPLLITTYDSSVWKSSVESARKLSHEKQIYLLHCLEASLAICGLCNDPPEDAVVSICGHVFCNQCICEHLTGDGNHCPAQCCKTQLNISTVFSKATLVSSLSDKPVLSDTREFSCSEFVESPERCSGCFDSSKMRATLNVLGSLAAKPKDEVNSYSENINNPTVVKAGEKAIVFSQWTRMLDLLEARLKDFCIQYRRLDGTMSVAARDKAVKDFNAQAEVSVMIMSLKAASLGLNMVAACRVILMDLWWNPTTEDQAIDRAHRIGQTRPVTVVRLTVKDTVEDRILALQQKKREMVASAFGEDKTGGRQSRLTEDDLKYLFMA